MDKITKKNFERAAILKDAVFRQRLTLTDMARDLGVTSAAVNRFAYGSSNPEVYRRWVETKLGRHVLIAMDAVS